MAQFVILLSAHYLKVVITFAATICYTQSKGQIITNGSSRIYGAYVKLLDKVGTVSGELIEFQSIMS